MKKYLTGIFLSIAIFSTDLTAESQKGLELFQNYWDMRVKLTYIEDIEKQNLITRGTEEFHLYISEIEEAEAAALENLYLMEQYNLEFLYAGEGKIYKDTFNKRRLVSKSICDATKNNPNKYLALTYGDIISYYMCYSVGDILAYGLSVKPAYEKALEIDHSFCPALINLGLWYYYAPAIFGGKRKAKKYFNNAAECALNNNELFFALINLSQVNFELKRYKEAGEQMGRLHNLFPDSKLVNLIIQENSNGESYFEYKKKHSSIIQEGDKYKKNNNIQ